MIRPLRLGLFIYECFRILTLIAVFIALHPLDSPAVHWLVFAAPGALFPLMALFLWLDVLRYRSYLPLFAAGKCVGSAVLLVWFIVSRQVTMNNDITGAVVLVEMILLSGDLFSIAAVLLIIRSVRNAAETPVLEDAANAPDTDMEEK